ncbi:MAG: hypothetical protein FJ146_09275 [Deltaproteobacteria bacterium]|nr:hypothetical protein [Deltaproteobacteria bacterium]
MEFNLRPTLATGMICILGFVAAACGGSGSGGGSSSSGGVVGAVINTTPNSSASNAWRFFTAGGERVFYGYDSYVKRINRISSNATTVQQSSQLSVPAQTDSWFAGPEGKVFFTIDDKALSTLNTESGVSTPVKTFAGRVISVAADATQGYYAFVDQYFAVTLLTMGQNGSVESQWTGGPLLGDGVTISAGDILPGGKLLIAGPGGALALVDIRESITKNSWQFQKIQLTDSTGLNFVAPVVGRSDRAIVGSTKSMSLLNVDSGAVLDNEVIGLYASSQKTGRVHVRYLDSATDKWKFITAGDGDSFARFELPNSDNLKLATYVEQTYLTDKNLNAVMKALPGISRRVFTVRLSDALVERSIDIGNETTIGLGDDEFSAMEPSALGVLSIYNLRTGVAKSFKGYNRKLLQRD